MHGDKSLADFRIQRSPMTAEFPERKEALLNGNGWFCRWRPKCGALLLILS